MFFGVALSINLAEQPARLALDDLPLLAQWKISFKVGFALQGSLTLAAGLATGLAAGLAGLWAPGGRFGTGVGRLAVC